MCVCVRPERLEDSCTGIDWTQKSTVEQGWRGMIHNMGSSVYLWDDVQVLIAQRKMLRIQPKRRSNHFEESASSCREPRILPHVKFQCGLELLHRLLFVPQYEGKSTRDDG